MSTFVSLFECIQDDRPLAPIKDELIEMKAKVKAEMDKGLSPDEMKVSKLYFEAILSAENIVEKIANKA